MTCYNDVAVRFAEQVNEAFTTEETLKTLYATQFPALTFGRTDRWNLVFSRLLAKAWEQHGPAVKASMTGYDRQVILKLLATILDYNLFSQVYLNLQDWALLRYRVADAETDVKKLQEKWAGKSPSPFDPKAKMFKYGATNENLTIEQTDYNLDLSTLKSLRIIPKITPALSFRVSPKGSTPALVDSANISMLGRGGDQYVICHPALRVFYLTWDAAPEIMHVGEDGLFRDDFLDYPFTSSSGGDTLNSVMAVRLLLTTLYQHLSAETHVVALPRMTSLMVMTDADPSVIEGFVDLVRDGWIADAKWPITLHQGSR